MPGVGMLGVNSKVVKEHPQQPIPKGILYCPQFLACIKKPRWQPLKFNDQPSLYGFTEK